MEQQDIIKGHQEDSSVRHPEDPPTRQSDAAVEGETYDPGTLESAYEAWAEDFMRRVATGIWIDGDANNVASKAMDLLLEGTGMEAGAVYLLNEARDILTVKADSIRGSNRFPATLPATPGDKRLVDLCLKTRKAACSDPALDEDRILVGNLRFAGCGAFPLLTNGTLRGVALLATGEESFRWRAERIAILTDACVLLAGALSNARLTEQVRRQERQWEQTFNSVVDMITIHDSDFKIVRANKAVLERLGLKDKQVIGRKCYELFHNAESPHPRCPHMRTLKTGMPAIMDTVYEFDDGLFLNSTAPMEDADGNVVGSVHIAHDITAINEMETGQREARIKLEESLRNMTFGFAIADAVFDEFNVPRDLVVWSWNPEAERITGIASEKVLDTRISRWNIDKEERGQFMKELLEVLQTGDQVTFSKWKYDFDDETKYLNIKAFRIDAKSIGVVFSDVTGEVRSQIELQKSKERYQLLFDNLSEAVMVVDTESFAILDVNQTFLNRYGYDYHEIASMSALDLIHEEDRKKFLFDLDRKMDGAKGAEGPLYLRHRRRDGEYLVVDSKTSLVILDENPIIMQMAVDITEKKQLEEQLQQAQKMECLNTLAGGIAHDFNNLLGGILGYASIAMTKLGSGSEVYNDLEIIHKTTKRAAGLTAQLLGFARGEPYSVKSFDINELVREVEEFLSRTIDKNIRIETDLVDEDLNVEGDETQIQQALINVCLNARDAMSEGGALTIRTQYLSREALEGDGRFEPEYPNYVKLEVLDTGCGMDEETKRRIFEPFFTTKPQGKGTGLGLAMVYGIINGHEGFLDVESEVGMGSTVIFYLPGTIGSAEKDEVGAVEVSGGTETVLVVDDEQVIAEMACEVLKRRGYNVLKALGGKQALEIFRDSGNRIDMVLLDMIMPDMSGWDTFHEIQNLKPGTPVLISTGYTKDSKAQKLLDLGARGFIPKPYQNDELLLKVREVLDSK